MVTARDPARIPVILEELRTFWESHSDYRLGQIIVAATTRAGRIDSFVIEDEQLMEGLKLIDVPQPNGWEPKYYGKERR